MAQDGRFSHRYSSRVPNLMRYRVHFCSDAIRLLKQLFCALREKLRSQRLYSSNVDFDVCVVECLELYISLYNSWLYTRSAYVEAKFETTLETEVGSFEFVRKTAEIYSGKGPSTGNNKKRRRPLGFDIIILYYYLINLRKFRSFFSFHFVRVRHVLSLFIQ